MLSSIPLLSFQLFPCSTAADTHFPVAGDQELQGKVRSKGVPVSLSPGFGGTGLLRLCPVSRVVGAPCPHRGSLLRALLRLSLLSSEGKGEFCIAAEFKKDCAKNWGSARMGRKAPEGSAARGREGLEGMGVGRGHHSTL